MNRPPSGKPHGEHSAHGPGPPARLLLVEDDFLILMEMERVLADAAFVVVGIASSADEAVHMAREERPDLAVMDIRLIGKRDGVDAAIEIFKETGIRCLFASAHNDADTRQRANAAQPLGWLPKPYSPEALVQAVRVALEQLAR